MIEPSLVQELSGLLWRYGVGGPVVEIYSDGFTVEVNRPVFDQDGLEVLWADGGVLVAVTVLDARMEPVRE